MVTTAFWVHFLLSRLNKFNHDSLYWQILLIVCSLRYHVILHLSHQSLHCKCSARMAGLMNKVYWAHNFAINTNHPSWLRRVEKFMVYEAQAGDYDVFRVKYTYNHHCINMKIFSFCHRKQYYFAKGNYYLLHNNIVQQRFWHFCFMMLSTPYWLQNYTFVVHRMYIRILSTVILSSIDFQNGKVHKGWRRWKST